MRARVLCLVLALAALGGCQSVPTAGTASGITPTPGPDTPHRVLRFRSVLVDPTAGSPRIVPSTSKNAAPVTDPAQAARIRQDPHLTDDPAAQQAALASIDCTQPDPLKGKDDPALPLATCDRSYQEYLLGPAVLDGSAVAKASYRHDTQQDAWVVSLSFTSAGQKKWSDYTGAHTGGFVAIVLDGQVQSSPEINGRIDGDTEITGNFTEQFARDFAASLNNH